jgi:hypothetical protein
LFWDDFAWTEVGSSGSRSRSRAGRAQRKVRRFMLLHMADRLLPRNAAGL